MSDRSPVLVRGVGDVGSAVAVVLFRAGYAVALHDEPAPATPRRGMAFADAVFDGWAKLDGLTAVRVKTPAELRHALNAGDVVPVITTPFAGVLDTASWSALIDARMRKRATPEGQRGLAPLTLGLGPNFVAGDNVDLAIETSWGDGLGSVIEAGAVIASRKTQSSRRSGCSRCARRSAACGAVWRAAASRFPRERKVIEVDARGDPAAAFGLGERPRRIADGMLKAMARSRVAVPA